MPDQEGGTPPGGGRMSHDVMDRASELPVSGPAATDTLAASGGLDLPGRALEGSTPEQQQDRADAEQVPPPTQVSVDKMDRETDRRSSLAESGSAGLQPGEEEHGKGTIPRRT